MISQLIGKNIGNQEKAGVARSIEGVEKERDIEKEREGNLEMESRESIEGQENQTKRKTKLVKLSIPTSLEVVTTGVISANLIPIVNSVLLKTRP